MDLEFFLRAPHERQAHHCVPEMMEFDDKETRLHRENQRRLSM